MSRIAIKTGLILAALFLAFVGFIKFNALWVFYHTPKDPSAPPTTFTVTPGSTFREVARSLGKEGIVSDPARLTLLGRIFGAHKEIKAGEYRIGPANSPGEILAILKKGKVLLKRLTVWEGANIYDVADTLKTEGFPAARGFLAAAFDASLLSKLNVPGSSAEGYLFPETYRFPRTESPQKIIRVMVGEFKKRFAEKIAGASKRLGLSPLQIVTLASLVEKETASPEEKPVIAGVFINRLKRGMLLQCDPTVIYGFRLFGKRLYNKHLETDHPYNTYTRPSLPPGPIANPGAASLAAAISPAKVRYLYFVSKGNGTHHFSITMAQHEKAVRRYQR